MICVSIRMSVELWEGRRSDQIIGLELERAVYYKNTVKLRIANPRAVLLTGEMGRDCTHSLRS